MSACSSIKLPSPMTMGPASAMILALGWITVLGPDEEQPTVTPRPVTTPTTAPPQRRAMCVGVKVVVGWRGALTDGHVPADLALHAHHGPRGDLHAAGRGWESGGGVSVRGTVGTRTGTGTHTRRHTAEGSMRGERGIRPRRVPVCAWEGTGTHLFCTFSAMTALAGGVRLRRAAGLGAVQFRPCVLPWNRGSPVGGSSHAPP